MTTRKATTLKPRKKTAKPAGADSLSMPEFPMPEIATEFSFMNTSGGASSKKKRKKIKLPFEVKNPGIKTIIALAVVAALIVFCIIMLLHVNWNSERVSAPAEAVVQKTAPVAVVEKKAKPAEAPKALSSAPEKKPVPAVKVAPKPAATAAKKKNADVKVAAQAKPALPHSAVKSFYGRAIDYTPAYVMLKSDRTQYVFYYTDATEYVNAAGKKLSKNAVFVCQMIRVSYYYKDKKFFAQKVVILQESDCVK